MSRAPRSRRRREAKRPALVLLSGTVTLLLVLAFVLLSARAPRGVPLLGYKTIYADVPTSGNLRIHSEVRIEGVRVGEVVGVTPDDGRARLRLKLDPGTGELPSDTTASVRGKGLLGARYLTLDPGRRTDTVRDGGTIRAGANPVTLGVADALETFDAETRGRLGQLVGGMGQGLLGRGRGLNSALAVTPQTQRDLISLADAVLAPPGAAARLLPDAASAAAAVGPATDDIAGGLDPARAALEPLKDQRSAVRATLVAAPPSLHAVQPALDESRQLLTAVRHLAGTVAVSLPPAPAGLRAATTLLRDAEQPLARTTDLLRRARPAVPAALQVTSALDPLLKPVRRALDDAQPLVTTLGAHGCDFVDFGDNWRSVLNQGAAGGTLIGPMTGFRVTVIAGPESVSGFGRAPKAFATDRDRFPAPCKYSRPQRPYRSAP
jgi:virulence factor Mce-like protein